MGERGNREGSESQIPGERGREDLAALAKAAVPVKPAAPPAASGRKRKTAKRSRPGR